MKKLIIVIITVALILSMAVTAHAVTPKLDIPSIEIPDISGSVKVELPDEFWEDYFEKHLVEISDAGYSMKGNDWFYWSQDWFQWWTRIVKRN